MRPVFKWILVVLMFATIGNLINYFKGNKNSIRTEEAIQSANKQYEDIRGSAIEKYPNKSVSESIALESNERAQNRLESDIEPNQKLKSAVSMFMGFYFINTRGRPAFCSEQGVDISSFVMAFEQEHASELTKVRSVLSKASFTEEQLYNVIKPQMRKQVIQDMNDLASMSKIGLTEACQLLADNGDATAADMHISKIQPLVFDVIKNGG